MKPAQPPTRPCDNTSSDEVCPSCGGFVDYLGEDTGWCRECEATFAGIPTVTKPCIHCGKTKPLTDFPRHPRCVDGHRNVCRPCSSKVRLAWRYAHLERDNDNWRRSYQRRRLAGAA